jgi:hypothetical protein
MSTSSSAFYPTPCYLATNRGFYRGKLPVTTEEARNASGYLFTSNIRQATPFNSFEEAEACFKKLLTSTEYPQTAIAAYFTVVAGLQAPLSEAAHNQQFDAAYFLLHGNKQPLAEEAAHEVHPANCICPQCLIY